MGWAEAAGTRQRSAGRQPNLDILTLRALFYARQCKSGVNPSFLGRAGSSRTREVSATLITLWNASLRELPVFQSLLVLFLDRWRI